MFAREGPEKSRSAPLFTDPVKLGLMLLIEHRAGKGTLAPAALRLVPLAEIGSQSLLGSSKGHMEDGIIVVEKRGTGTELLAREQRDGRARQAL